MDRIDNPRSFQKFKKTPFIISTIFLIFTVSLYLFFYKQISDNIKTEQDVEIKWQDEAMRRNEIESLNQTIKAISEERALLETHFAQSSDVVPFLDNIAQLSQEANTSSEISSVDILKDKSGLQVGFKASGTFEAVYKFLTLLENSPYEVDFISVDMQKSTDQSPSGQKTGNQNWNANFVIKLLSFIQ